MKVLVCGGGTGGHIYPALAVVNEMNKAGSTQTQVMWIGTQGQMEEKIVPRAGYQLETVAGGPIVGVSVTTKMKNGVKLISSVAKAGQIIRRFEPDVLLMTGGYVNAPVALAARWLRLPAAIYLPDIEPGRAIKFLMPFVEKVACTANASAAFVSASKMVVTGYPVRPVLRAAATMDKKEALAVFNLTPDRQTLFVFGGSRGARSINRALMAALPQLLDKYQVIHISGTLDWPEVEAYAQQLTAGASFYRPYPYLHDEMGAAFRAADLTLARAGASMLGECPAFGLPSILVPYPHAWRYQKVNADYLVQNGAAIRLDDADLVEQLGSTVESILQNESKLNNMRAAAQQLDRPQAAADIAQLLRQLASRRGRS